MCCCCCLLFAVCCLLFVVCCLLFVVCCLLFAVCCLLLFVVVVVVVVVIVVVVCVCCLLFLVCPFWLPPCLSSLAVRYTIDTAKVRVPDQHLMRAILQHLWEVTFSGYAFPPLSSVVCFVWFLLPLLSLPLLAALLPALAAAPPRTVIVLSNVGN